MTPAESRSCLCKTCVDSQSAAARATTSRLTQPHTLPSLGIWTCAHNAQNTPTCYASHAHNLFFATLWRFCHAHVLACRAHTPYCVLSPLLIAAACSAMRAARDHRFKDHVMRHWVAITVGLAEPEGRYRIEKQTVMLQVADCPLDQPAQSNR